jgi:lysyl-tRNA synthetase class 1
MDNFREHALNAKAWPFAEARSLLKRLNGKIPDKGFVLFETGYGPSGLPHIGTFGEVARTSMVLHAFSILSDVPCRLFPFSDDMDGLRRVPENLPNQKMLKKHIGQPLSAIPDPFGTHESLGAHNNARLMAFLDEFGFNYEFMSATNCYKSGIFDKTLLKVLECFEEVNNVILPTLGKERRQTYSPFLPICPKTGRVLQVPVIKCDLDSGTIVYESNEGEKVEVAVTGGHCKLQWKVDWAMRWTALDVDYEMSGKDLIESVNLSGKICKILNGNPPAGFTYELFLDENGEKISKSRGNGLSLEDWLRYAPAESLSLFMYQKPKTAKRLHFDVIPKNVDEHITHLSNLAQQDPASQIENPAWHIHQGVPLNEEEAQLSFNIILNLVSVCHSKDKNLLWHFISRYQPNASVETAPNLDKLLDFAINYYTDFVQSTKCYRKATQNECRAMEDLLSSLLELEKNVGAEKIQEKIYEVGKRHPFPELKVWFQALYEILLGQPKGPRMGSFIALYGIKETCDLLKLAIAGKEINGNTNN